MYIIFSSQYSVIFVVIDLFNNFFVVKFNFFSCRFLRTKMYGKYITKMYASDVEKKRQTYCYFHIIQFSIFADNKYRLYNLELYIMIIG